MASTLTSLAAAAVAEILQVFQTAEVREDHPLELIVEEIFGAKDGRIILYGVGREGLMMKALCMRLFHLGLKSFFVGDMITPAIGAGDLFIASAGPGSFHTVNALLQLARDAGARVMVITAQRHGSAANFAHSVVVVPAQTMADDLHHREGLSEENSALGGILPMGSVYEGALFVLFEVAVLCLLRKLGETAESMRSRHTNLE